MIKIPTVLILGAGASCPFKFPSAGDLVRRIRLFLDNQSKSSFRTLLNLGHEQKSIIDFQNALTKADPASVDVWLERNHDYLKVGKAAIALAILQSERGSDLYPDKSWYKHFFWLLSRNTSFRSFGSNNISIISFNYDRSLEEYLYRSFRYSHLDKSDEECFKVLNGIDIIHIYGSLGPLPWQQSEVDLVAYGDCGITAVRHAANNIEIMSEHQSPNSGKFEEIHLLLEEAERIFFFGFGYHETNLKRLKITTVPKSLKDSIKGTSLNLSITMRNFINSLRVDILNISPNFSLFPCSIYDFLYNKYDLTS